MGTGRLHPVDFKRASSQVLDEGDFGEIGVFKAHLFHRVAKMAMKAGRKAHAFDSFQGMAEPTKHDKFLYKKGGLNVGGVDQFDAIMKDYGVDRDHYVAHVGFIPECFVGAESLEFCFVYIDVDHYQPTLEAFEWVKDRMTPNGVIGFDDYFKNGTILASKAIKEILPQLRIIYRTNNNQIFCRLV